MDLLEMLRDKPPDFDIRTAQQSVFVGPKSTIESVALVLSDSSSYFEVYTGNEVKDLVISGKMQGAVIPVSKVKDMAILLLDSYALMMNQSCDLSSRLKLALRIGDLLETVKLL